jgi:uncharacterized membrane protein
MINIDGGGFDFGSSLAYGVTANGSTVVGIRYNISSSPTQAFRWTAGTGMVGLSAAPNFALETANAVSADGSVIAGYESTFSGAGAARWTAGTGFTLLPVSIGGSNAFGISSDGSAIVGYELTASGFQPALWTDKGTALKDLGGLPGAFFGEGLAATDMGAFVIGTSYTDFTSAGTNAFIWNQANGLRSLQDVLASEYGLSSALSGWHLMDAYGMTPDGRYLVGDGLDPNGSQEAWLVDLGTPLVPEPGGIAGLVGFVVFGAAWRFRRTGRSPIALRTCRRQVE